MVRRVLLPSLLAMGLWASATPDAWAQRSGGNATANAGANLLQLGRRQYEDLHFEEAIQTLSAAVVRRGNTRDTEVQIYELLALSYFSMNRREEAEGAWRLVLDRDRAHELPVDDVGPRVYQFFHQVSERWKAENPVQTTNPQNPTVVVTTPVVNNTPVAIEHRSPAQSSRGQTVSLTARVDDPGHRVSRLVLAYRTGSTGIFRRADATGSTAEPGVYSATIPSDNVKPPLVEYYFEAVDSRGLAVFARGDALAPLRVAVPDGPNVGVIVGVSVGAGVVVIAAAVIAGVVASGSSPSRLNISVVGQ